MKNQLASLEEAFNKAQESILGKFLTQQPVSTEEMHHYLAAKDAYQREVGYQPLRA